MLCAMRRPKLPIEGPIIHLLVLRLRQNNVLHEQNTVNDGTGGDAEQLKQE